MSYDGPSFVGLSDFEVLSKFSFQSQKFQTYFFHFRLLKRTIILLVKIIVKSTNNIHP